MKFRGDKTNTVICKKCNSVAYFNSYFKGYFCYKCGELFLRKPLNIEKIQCANKQELAAILEKFTYGRYDPWSSEFHNKFCKTCPTITEQIMGYGKELSFHECDYVDGVCPNGDMIEWWLEQEVKEDAVHN